MQGLLPEASFRLLAVSVRFPQGLAREIVLTPVQPGVYEARHFTGLIQVIVVQELPQEEHNAMLYLFSTRLDQRSNETSTLVQQLVTRYPLEASSMSEIMERIAHDPDLFRKLTPEEVLRRIREETIEELLRDMPAEKRLKGLSVDEMWAALSPQVRAELIQRAREDDSSGNSGTAGPSEL